jgi:formylglycine-generating enzyme required for sulfatase activity
MTRLAPASLLVLLALALACAGRAGAGEAPGGAQPAGVRDAPALVRALLAADQAQVPDLEARLRALGPPAAPALRAARAAAPELRRTRLDRVLALLLDDYRRRQAPAGMVYVPAGALEVPRTRAPWGPSGTRTHVGAFYLDRTEVTVGAWRRWLASLEAGHEGAVAAAHLTVPPADAAADLPVTGVRYPDAVRYAREARGGRLPTAQEFERALRGAGVATYPWGEAMHPRWANLRDQGPGRPQRVGTHPHDVGPFGCLDLVGNVAEWSSTQVRQGTRGHYPLVLGGSFDQEPGPVLTWRGHDRMRARPGPRERVPWIGLRVARDVPDLPR